MRALLASLLVLSTATSVRAASTSDALWLYGGSLGNSWQIFDWSSYTIYEGTTGSASLDLPTLSPGLTWDTSRFGAPGTVTVEPPVVEPPIVIIDPPVIIDPTDPNGPIDPPDITLDVDGDGMMDEWELANGLDPTDPSDADKDDDKDGLTNLQEFEFGSDPHLADSDEGGASDFEEWVLNQAVMAVEQLLQGWSNHGDPGGMLGILPGEGEGTTISGENVGDDSATGAAYFSISSSATLTSNCNFQSAMTGGVTVVDSSAITAANVTKIGNPLSAPAKRKGELKTSNVSNSSTSTGEVTVIDDSGLIPVDGGVFGPGHGGSTGNPLDQLTGLNIDKQQIKATIMDLIDVVSKISKDGYAPYDDTDDGSAMAVVSDLKHAQLWVPLAGLVSGKLSIDDLLNLFFGPQINYNFGGFGSKTPTTADANSQNTLDGNIASNLSTSAANAAKAANYGGGGGGYGGGDDTSAKSGGGSIGGSRSSGGGFGGGSSAGSGGSRSSSGGSYAPHIETTHVITATGAPPPEPHHHGGFDGPRDRGSDGGSFGSSSSSKKTSSNAPAIAHALPTNNTSGGWWFMGIVPALGFVARRLLESLA